jgi:recombination protein RecT
MKVGGAAGLQGLAEAMKGRLAAVLPKHVTPERMLKALMVAASKTPAIFECTQESVVKSLMDASSLGLDCSGTLGSGYLIPFNKNTKNSTGQWESRKECQFIPGYRGLIDLARRGGQIATIEAHAVYAQDKLLLQYGTESKLVHEPYLAGDRRDEFVCFYAVATLRDGTKQIEVMTLADVMTIRDAAMAKNRQSKPSGPWADHFGEMARKTVVRRLCKYLPLSPELEKAFELDDTTYAQQPEMIDVSQIDPSQSRTDSLAGRLSAVEPTTAEVIDTDTGEVTTAQVTSDAPSPDEAAEIARREAEEGY